MDAIKEVIDQAYDEDLEERTVTNGELSRSDIMEDRDGHGRGAYGRSVLRTPSS